MNLSDSETAADDGVAARIFRVNWGPTSTTKLVFEFVCREAWVIAEWALSTEETHEDAEPPEPPDRTEPELGLPSSPSLRCLPNF